MKKAANVAGKRSHLARLRGLLAIDRHLVRKRKIPAKQQYLRHERNTNEIWSQWGRELIKIAQNCNQNRVSILKSSTLDLLQPSLAVIIE
jgi:hypothetical protein